MSDQRFSPPAVPSVAVWPVSMFGAVMGLSGLALAWRLASHRLGVAAGLGDAFAALAWLLFGVLALAQARRAWREHAAWTAEWTHPVSGRFVGTFWISLLLLPMLLPPEARAAARALWLLGATGIVAFVWQSLRGWSSAKHALAEAAPPWLIPAVGLLDVPLAVPSLGLPQLHQAMLFALGAGMLLAVPLFALVLVRLALRAPLPPPLRPSQLILAAPFLVGCSAYVSVTGQVDGVARALFYLGMLVLLWFLLRLRDGWRGPFQLSWWAISFPLAASAVAGLRVAASPVANAVALGWLGLVSAVVAVLLWCTARGLLRSAREAAVGVA
jgi:tellurite resistance protein